MFEHEARGAQLDEDFELEFAALVDRYSEAGAAIGLDAAPGPGLAQVLAGLDPAGLTDYDLAQALAASARVASWATAGQLAVISELARRMDPDPRRTTEGWRYVADEVSAALSISRHAADAQVSLALSLKRLPGTAAALERGAVDVVKARVIAEGTGQLPDADARAVEQRVLPRAGAQTPASSARR